MLTIYGIRVHAIHFMALKHCKHDREQHHLHANNIFLTKFYGITNFVHARVTLSIHKIVKRAARRKINVGKIIINKIKIFINR